MSGPFVFSRRKFMQTAGGFSALSLAASMDRLGLASAAARMSVVATAAAAADRGWVTRVMRLS